MSASFAFGKSNGKVMLCARREALSFAGTTFIRPALGPKMNSLASVGLNEWKSEIAPLRPGKFALIGASRKLLPPPYGSSCESLLWMYLALMRVRSLILRSRRKISSRRGLLFEIEDV